MKKKVVKKGEKSPKDMMMDRKHGMKEGSMREEMMDRGYKDGGKVKKGCK